MDDWSVIVCCRQYQQVIRGDINEKHFFIKEIIQFAILRNIRSLRKSHFAKYIENIQILSWKNIKSFQEIYWKVKKMKN